MEITRIVARARWLSAVVVAAASIAGVGAGPTRADEVKVFSAGAVRAIVTELAQAFRQETGHTVTLSFGPVGVTRQRLASAEPRADLARTGMGVGVREGAPKPDIGTSDTFKATLLRAKSIVYVDPAQGATSGIHFASVLDRLGIAEAVKGKTQLVPGGYPAEKVATGEAEVVVHQISEIVPVKGVVLVGPLPPDLQKITVYSAGLAARSAKPEAARAFIAFLARPAFKPKFAAAGLDYRP